MRVCLLTHYRLFPTVSLPKFSGALTRGLSDLGIDVVELPCPVIFGRNAPVRLAKWLGYIDQFVLFPSRLRRAAREEPQETLFVLTDNALGPWLPPLASRPHVVHCHDFLAQRSALGEFSENPTGWSGRRYQALIRRGLQHGQAFISVSEKTRSDLHTILSRVPRISEVVPNPLNFDFRPDRQPLELLRPHGLQSTGFILHVGGNQWYKNRGGVVEIYARYASQSPNPVPLICIGPAPSATLRDAASKSAGRIYFLSGLSGEELRAAYSAAGVLLFPSLEEGFGWPPAEAQACGCPVITTDHSPMREVAGISARLIPRRPQNDAGESWANAGASALQEILALDSSKRSQLVEAGFENVNRFASQRIFSAIGELYQRALDSFDRRQRH